MILLECHESPAITELALQAFGNLGNTSCVSVPDFTSDARQFPVMDVGRVAKVSYYDHSVAVNKI